MPTNFNSSACRRAPEVTLKSCDQIAVVKNPVEGELYSAFLAKIIATAGMTGADVILTDVPVDAGSGVGDRVNINGKSGTRTGVAIGASDDLTVVAYDSVNSLVHFVQDASDIDISASNVSVVIPGIVHWLRKPTAVA